MLKRKIRDYLEQRGGWTFRSVDVVMLGDSLTQEGSWQDDLLGINVVNLGVGGDTTQSVIDRLAVAHRLRPKRLFLLVGVNDLNTGVAPSATIANYETILGALKQHLNDTVVYPQSILPVGHPWTRARNADIELLNGDIRTLARRRSLTFVDLHSHFRGPDGGLREELSRDGLHLARAGYDLWCSLIRPLVRDL